MFLLSPFIRMKINTVNYNNQNTAFKSIWTNKAVLKGFETISDHSASFIAATSLAMASFVRPISIAHTPNVKKENKEHAIANSIASGLIKFAMVEAIALPIENSIKKIDKNPQKYLTQKTIDTFQSGAKSLSESGNYKFATQFIKQSSGFITAIPKSILTVALIPPIIKFIFGDKKKSNLNEEHSVYNQPNRIFDNDFPNNKPSFKGIITEKAAIGIGKILNNSLVQNAAQKFSTNSANITRNMVIATDLLLSGSFALRTMKSEKIDKDRKKPLIVNNLISTGISVAGGYSIDKAVKKGTDKFIDKFARINKDNPKLAKYIEGINILRPTIIFAAIYYGILPIISTFIADKTDNQKTEKTN